MTDAFESSDSVRSAAALRHARTATLKRPLRLELGGQLPGVEVCYETYGQLSPERDNAVLICHALSGDSHVARHDPSDAPGWWEEGVGPGRMIDTGKYFVISPNVLGGCRGTTGPGSTNPATGRPYGAEFPPITIADIVEVQRLLLEELGVERLLAAVGGSMGGMQVLEWAVRHPQRLRAAIVLASCPRLSAQAVAFDVVGRNAIRKDPAYRGGQYYDDEAGPADGLAIARMIGHITYLSCQAMAEKFDADRDAPRQVDYAFESEFSVGSYLAHQGGRFVERFDANSYIALSLAMDRFDLARGAGSLADALRPASCRWLVASFTSDWLFPPSQSRAIVDAVIAAERPVTYCNIESDCGHDAFLLPGDIARYGPLVEAFLGRTLDGGDGGEGVQAVQAGRCSIFRGAAGGGGGGTRLDYELIEGLIDPGAGVLDLGCGDGELLARLRRRGHRDLLGLELDPQAVLAAVRRGLDVVQANLDEGLNSFRDKQFETVLLSLTLQSVRRPDELLAEMLRVGERCIVSFPNFAHADARRQLCEEGVAPVTPGLPHTWYDSPNRHFLSIKDFEGFCRDLRITVHRRVALDTAQGREVTEEANLNADLAIFVISRP